MYSDLTMSDSPILKKYQPDMNKLDTFFGIQILSKYCYSICPGVVQQVLNSPKGSITVSIQYSETLLLRYGNLLSTDLNPGQLVNYKDTVGLCNTSVIFERCTKQKNEAVVVVNNILYYKQDPTPLLAGTIKLDLTPTTIKTIKVDPNIQTIF